MNEFGVPSHEQPLSIFAMLESIVSSYQLAPVINVWRDRPKARQLHDHINSRCSRLQYRRLIPKTHVSKRRQKTDTICLPACVQARRQLLSPQLWLAQTSSNAKLPPLSPITIQVKQQLQTTHAR